MRNRTPLYLVLLLSLIMTLVPSSAQAQAPIPELYSDTYKQTLASSTHIDHFGYHKWASAATFHQNTWGATDKMTIYNSTVYNMHPLASTAIYSWLSLSQWPSRFQLTYVSSPSSAFVDIQQGSCNNGSPICVQHSNPYNANPRHARWWNYSNIYYTVAFTGSGYTNGFRQTAFAHEFGHVLGRGEAYALSGGNSVCSSQYPASIMDTIPIGSMTHCDGIGGPTSWDGDVLVDSWDEGFYTWYASNSVGSTYLEAWKDYAWNEGVVLQEWYRWNGSNYISFYSTTGPVVDSGSNNYVNQAYASIDKYASFSIVPSTYGVPNNSYIKLCTTPIMAGISGSRLCSPGILHSY